MVYFRNKVLSKITGIDVAGNCQCHSGRSATDVDQDRVRVGWESLLKREWAPTLAILLGGVLLQSMSVLMLTTVLPSIVGELGGVPMLSWPTTAFLASSIVAASCAGMLAAAVGPRAACWYRDSAVVWRRPQPMSRCARLSRKPSGHGRLH